MLFVGLAAVNINPALPSTSKVSNQNTKASEQAALEHPVDFLSYMCHSCITFVLGCCAMTKETCIWGNPKYKRSVGSLERPSGRAQSTSPTILHVFKGAHFDAESYWLLFVTALRKFISLFSMRLFLVLLTLGLLADAKKRLKILVSVPGVSYSHLQFQGALADLLVDAGHDVVRISA